ncbi:manganese catalase family protein, partial [Amycolatopsis sp. H6(2020)]|nr:manganese catalase family protein [Amycolatopsis sp. H6(2020)]
LPADSNGYPWNGKYIVASGNLLADFRANAAAEAQGRLQTARLDEEDQTHNHTIWHLSDGPDGAKGTSWTTDAGLDYLMDPEPL